MSCNSKKEGGTVNSKITEISERRRIPIYRLEFEEDFIERYKEGCRRILTSDAISEGEYVRKFESEFSRFIGAPHAIATGSGTDALEVAFRALGVRGKTVIIPTNTFMATAIAAERAGARVMLLDIEDDTFALDPNHLHDAIDRNTAAVVLVHIGGIISKYVADIVDICARHDVPLVEDAAHAHGSTRGEFRAGTIGAIGCFSFFPTKVMTTAEGGMVTTADDKTADLIRSIKNFGRDPSNGLLCINDGGNFKMTEFQGLMGVLEMGRVARRMEKRNMLARRYVEDLAQTSYEVITHNDGRNSCYKQIVRIQTSQEGLHRFCREHGVSLTGEVYRYPVHQQPVFRKQFAGCHFPVADKFSKSHICPPLYPELEPEDIRYISDVLKMAAERL